MNEYEQTKSLLKKYHLKANKNLGQNFLIDDEILDKIIEDGKINQNDLIIEVRPGLGTLTQRLLEKSNKVIAIELDPNMVKILNDRFQKEIDSGQLEVINEDILKINIDEIVNKRQNINKVKVIANLPYYITTPIITKFLETQNKINDIIVMVQKEVAQRLIEKPRSNQTGAITYLVDFTTSSYKVLDVPRNCFLPAPKVDSQVIHMEKLAKPKYDVLNPKIMFKIIKVSFLNRRKTLVNNLVSSNVFETKQMAKDVLEKIGLSEKIRPENMKTQDFVNLTNEYINSFKMERK